MYVNVSSMCCMMSTAVSHPAALVSAGVQPAEETSRFSSHTETSQSAAERRAESLQLK